MMSSTIKQILECILIPLLGALISYLIAYINQKRKDLQIVTDNETAQKYIDLLADTITKCVLATQQTYVDDLKRQGLFNEEAQKEALSRTYKAIMAILTEDAQEYLTQIYGDLSKYIRNAIESQVLENKRT